MSMSTRKYLFVVGLFIGVVFVIGGFIGGVLARSIDQGQSNPKVSSKSSNSNQDIIDDLKQQLANKGQTLRDLETEVSRERQSFIALKQKMENSVEHRQLKILLEDFFKNTNFEVYSQGPYLAVRMPNTAFAFSSTILSDEAVKSLKRVSEVLQKHNDRYFLIVEGHTDNVGFKRGSRIKSNRQLGANRASEVVKALETFDANPEDMMLASWGEFMPVIVHEQETPEPLNRRIELVFAPKRVVKKVVAGG